MEIDEDLQQAMALSMQVLPGLTAASPAQFNRHPVICKYASSGGYFAHRSNIQKMSQPLLQIQTC